LITTSYAQAHLRDPFVAADGELFILGLGPHGRAYKAAPDGDFAGGVTTSTGFGADTITVNGVHSRPGVHTVTTLNTGLGDDHVYVNLAANTLASFVLNTQGPINNLLKLATSLFTGDANTPADRVDVYVNGTKLSTSQFVV